MFLKLGKRSIELRTVILAVAAMGLVAFLITAAVMIGSRRADTVGESAGEPESSRFDWIEPDLLLVENELLRGSENSWIWYRPRREWWTEEEASEHWIDPREIGVEVLGAQVEQSIRDVLEAVP